MALTKEIKIESDLFEQARLKFNDVMQKMLKSMKKSNSDEGSITLKVDVQLFENDIAYFIYKVNSSVNVKEKDTGIENPKMALVYNENLRRYELEHVSEAQASIFDDEYDSVR